MTSYHYDADQEKRDLCRLRKPWEFGGLQLGVDDAKHIAALAAKYGFNLRDYVSCVLADEIRREGLHTYSGSIARLRDEEDLPPRRGRGAQRV